MGQYASGFGKLALFANFATIKKDFSKNLSAHIILVLDATFVPNFLGLLSPEISFGKNSHLDMKLISPSIVQQQYCTAL